MDAAREAVRSLRRQVLRQGRAPGIDHVPGSAFEQHIYSAFRDLGFKPAHHACQGQRASLVGNQNGKIIKGAFDIIERDHFFAFLGEAGDNRGIFMPGGLGALPQNIVIEGVQRFTQFQHGIVGGIYQRIDRAHTRRPQAQLRFVGAGLNFDAFDQPEYEARVEFGIGDLDFDAPCDRWPIHRNT